MRHLRVAEVALGRSFQVPMTDGERMFFTNHLLSLGLEKGTVLGYLSAIRFYEMGLGVHNPAKNSELSQHLMTGSANLRRDPRAASGKKERRPITCQMLGLLANAIAINKDWSDYEKSLRWSICLLCWWGSFRLGETVDIPGYELKKFSLR